MNIYITDNEKIQRLISALDITVQEAHREVQAAYISKAGVWQQVFASRFEYSYTGEARFEGDPEGDWELHFLSSGTLTVTSIGGSIDVCGIGGGAGGKAAGGGSGYLSNLYDLAAYPGTFQIIVGRGGAPGENGEATSFNGMTVAAGGKTPADALGRNGGDGGCGGGGFKSAGRKDMGTAGGSDGGDGENGSNPGGKGQNSSMRAFGDGELLGGGGAAPCIWAVGEQEFQNPGQGGAPGGGDSGYNSGDSYIQPTAGKQNSGGGGAAEAPGGSGKLIVRNHRRAAA